MGAKCCASEAASRARKDQALDPFADEGVKVETGDSLEGPGKPLWLLEHEEAASAAKKSQPSKENPPLPPPESPPQNPPPETQVPQEVEAAPAAEKPVAKAKAKARSGRAVTAEGKARARSRARQEANTVPAARPAEETPPAPAPETPVQEELSPRKPNYVPGGTLYHVLRITVVSARGLRNADSIPGKSDPYCTCEISGKPSSKFRTKVVNDTLEPMWHHKVELSGFGCDDCLTFSVFDKDTITRDDFLGRAVLRKQEVIPFGFKGELSLRDDKGRGCGYLELWVKLIRSYYVSSQVKPSVKDVGADEADPEDVREATVTVHSAKDLRNADWGPGQGLSDPYVIVEVPRKSNSTFRTPAEKNTLNPKWEFTATLPGYTMGDPIVFTVMDKDVVKADDFLGRATIEGDMLYSGGFYGELKLSDQGKIKVKVLIGPPPNHNSEAEHLPEPPRGVPAEPAVQAAGSKKNKSAEDSKKEKQQVEEPSDNTSSALLDAVERGDAKAVRRLLTAGASLDVTNSEGMNAMHICAARGHEDLMARLLKMKAKTRLMGVKTTEAKDTPLHLAARSGHKAICVMLVKEGASAHGKNASGKAPADLASNGLAKWLQSEDPANTPPPWLK